MSNFAFYSVVGGMKFIWTLTEPKNMCLWGFKMKSDKNGFNEKYLSENGF